MEGVTIELQREGNVLYPSAVSFRRWPTHDANGDIVPEAEIIDEVYEAVAAIVGRPAEAGLVEVEGEKIEKGKRVVQTVIVSKEEAETAEEAARIVRRMGYKTGDVDTTSTSHRFRQKDPGNFKRGSYKTFQVPGKTGVSIVYAELKD